VTVREDGEGRVIGQSGRRSAIDQKESVRVGIPNEGEAGPGDVYCRR
jgi:hypothetical protein